MTEQKKDFEEILYKIKFDLMKCLSEAHEYEVDVEIIKLVATISLLSDDLYNIIEKRRMNKKEIEKFLNNNRTVKLSDHK